MSATVPASDPQSERAGQDKNVSTLPRVLFVSVNPFSDTSNNGKTFSSFFRGYDPDRLAQLYFHRELPARTVCQNFYRVTDEHLLASFPFPSRVLGEKVGGTSSETTPIPVAAHSALKESRLARLVRQLLWARVSLDNPQLLAWMDDFAPDVIMFCGGDAAALYPKVSTLAKHCGARVVYYITDDYVLPTPTKNPAAQVSRLWTRHVFRRMAARADLVITIGQAMSDTYRRVYGISSRPVMNVVDLPEEKPAARRTDSASSSHPLRLVYAGSFHSNRWRVLVELADAIRSVRDEGVPITLDIFGPRPEPDVLASLNHEPFAVYRGLLDPEGLSREVANADVLVHVEADDPASRSVTALSVSTKIPEYLASGRPTLAVGPEGIASMDYLSNEDAAIVVRPGDQAALRRSLKTLAMDPRHRDAIATKGFTLARANHDGREVRRQLWSLLNGLSR